MGDRLGCHRQRPRGWDLGCFSLSFPLTSMSQQAWLKMGVEERQCRSPAAQGPVAKSGSRVDAPGVGFLGPAGVRGTFLAAEVPSSTEEPSCEPRVGAQSSLPPGLWFGGCGASLVFTWGKVSSLALLGHVQELHAGGPPGRSQHGGGSAGSPPQGQGELLQPHHQQPCRHRELAAAGRRGCLHARGGTAAPARCTAPSLPLRQPPWRGSLGGGHWPGVVFFPARPTPFPCLWLQVAALGTAQLLPGQRREQEQAAPRASPLPGGWLVFEVSSGRAARKE